MHVSDAWICRGYVHCGTKHRPNFANSAPTLADVNGDGKREVVVVGNVYNCGTDPYTDLYDMPFILNADRSRWHGDGFDWTSIPAPDDTATPLSEDYNIIESVAPNPVVADLDNDGYQEILFASYDGRVHAYWLDKTEHGHWPYAVYQAAEGFYRFASRPWWPIWITTVTPKCCSPLGRKRTSTAEANCIFWIIRETRCLKWNCRLLAPVRPPEMARWPRRRWQTSTPTGPGGGGEYGLCGAGGL